VSRSALMVYASFLLFVPTFMTQVYHTSASFAARVGSLYALGCFVAVTSLSQPFARLMGSSSTSTTPSSQRHRYHRAKVLAVLSLFFVGATGSSLAQWLHVRGVVRWSPLTSAAWFAVWGLSFALPFYLPPSLYALSRGGAESSATIADVFDIGGFGLLAWFNGYVARVAAGSAGSGSTATAAAAASSWTGPFAVTTACALTSWMALGTAVWRESGRKPSQTTAVPPTERSTD
jgi:hypothetical protein